MKEPDGTDIGIKVQSESEGEENFRRSLLISRGDLMTFIERPISAFFLFICVVLIGAQIYASYYHASGNLFLDAQGNGYGFPVVPTLRNLLQGDDAKYL